MDKKNKIIKFAGVDIVDIESTVKPGILEKSIITPFPIDDGAIKSAPLVYLVHDIGNPLFIRIPGTRVWAIIDSAELSVNSAVLVTYYQQDGATFLI